MNKGEAMTCPFGRAVSRSILILGVAMLLQGPVPDGQAQIGKKRNVTEIFHVSRAGQRGAAETRETLM